MCSSSVTRLINTDNPLGYDGKLAIAVAVFMKVGTVWCGMVLYSWLKKYWTGSEKTLRPDKIMSVISKLVAYMYVFLQLTHSPSGGKVPSFQGFQQHDAQEFLSFLLGLL